MDLYAPLLHEFTYQAMCNDLLDIEDGTKYQCVLPIPLSESYAHESVGLAVTRSEMLLVRWRRRRRS